MTRFILTLMPAAFASAFFLLSSHGLKVPMVENQNFAVLMAFLVAIVFMLMGIEVFTYALFGRLVTVLGFAVLGILGDQVGIGATNIHTNLVALGSMMAATAALIFLMMALIYARTQPAPVPARAG